MKRIIKWILNFIVCISVTIFLILSLIIIPSEISHWFMSIRLARIEPEIEESISYCLYDTLYFSDDELNANKILESEGYVLREYLVKLEDDIYMIISADKTLGVAKIKADGTGLQILFQDTFFEKTNENYQRRTDQEYSKRYSYYYDGRIVLTDQRKLVEYSIEDNSYDYFKYSDYIFPDCPISVECLEDDALTIQNSGHTQIYELDKLISDSQSIKALYEHRYGPKEGTNTTGTFLKRVQLFQDDLYVVGAVRDFLGCGFAVLMKYDPEDQQLRYHSFYDGNGSDASMCWYYYVVEDIAER